MEDCPLFLHRQYQREEVLVALGLPQLVGTFPTQAGRFWHEHCVPRSCCDVKQVG